MWGDIAELIIPRSCAGCGSPGDVLCGACRHSLREVPHLVSRRRELGVRVFALGDYSTLRKNLIVQMKEYNNQAIRPYVGAVVAAGLSHLWAQGEIPRHCALVPAPTRARSARLRGGDPMTDVCVAAAAAHTHGLSLDVAPVLTLARTTADQSTLNADERWLNMRQAVTWKQARTATATAMPRNAIVVDDVVTTGATLAASAAALRARGVVVRAAIVLADAR